MEIYLSTTTHTQCLTKMSLDNLAKMCEQWTHALTVSALSKSGLFKYAYFFYFKMSFFSRLWLLSTCMRKMKSIFRMETINFDNGSFYWEKNAIDGSGKRRISSHKNMWALGGLHCPLWQKTILLYYDDGKKIAFHSSVCELNLYC